MKDFFKKLFSDSREVSSKRVIAVIALFLLIAVIIAIILGKVVDSSNVYALIGLITGNSAMTLGERKQG